MGSKNNFFFSSQLELKCLLIFNKHGRTLAFIQIPLHIYHLVNIVRFSLSFQRATSKKVIKNNFAFYQVLVNVFFLRDIAVR